jgi:hypothetical protein
MKKLKYLIWSFVAFSGVACEEIVQLELPDGGRAIVVESTITTKTEPWSAHITLSQPYFNQADPVFIEDALVTIKDDQGGLDTLHHTDTGLYQTKDPKMCVPGRSYTMSISYNGETFEAQEFCNFQNPIDTFTSYFLPENNGFIQKGNYAFMQAEEWVDPGNHYWWKIYRNDTFVEGFGFLLEPDEVGPGTPNDAYFNSNIDTENPLSGIAQGILPRPFPFLFEPGDSVFLEQYSISRTYYNFLLELQNQANQSGTPFDPPPANPINNFSGNVLGYFAVANLVTASTVIE